ncbi:MAG: quinone-dependent dihydroorotate dehydrogenase [Bacteroidia bacterium]|nr:quinone-dependent dihydroorotate dehydrogenase [Bacteroidia bacterium]
MYKSLLRPIFFSLDAEKAHHLTFSLLKFSLSLPLVRDLFRINTELSLKSLEVKQFGLTFKNPVGLAAGFDKDAYIGDKWKYMGFGFVEFGTVTPRSQAGNPKPRLFRLLRDRAVINRMGFNNAGADAMLKKLKRMKKGDMVVGMNIGKNKDTPNEKAVDDYVYCFELLFDYVDYFVVNVSSPNTPGLRSLQEKEPLTQLLLRLQDLNQKKESPKPLLLKIAPDLTESQLDDIVEVAEKAQLSGLIATNTTISRADLDTPEAEVEALGAGGLSGLPLTHTSWEIMNYIHKKTDGKLPLIGVGGIMEPLDAKMRMQGGASLVQVYSGYVYEGPGFVKRILKALAFPK